MITPQSLKAVTCPLCPRAAGTSGWCAAHEHQFGDAAWRKVARPPRAPAIRLPKPVTPIGYAEAACTA
jgi:hypothetical protein